MTFVTRWDPFREISGLQNQMNRLFQDFNRQGGNNDELTATGSFVPPVDVYEDEHNVVLKLEVPGVNQNEIDIRLENDSLVIRGERKLEKEEKEENFHRIERRYGMFTRSFTLPNTIDTQNVNATYENGVLKVQMAKKAETKPKQIKIGGGSSNSGSESPTLQGKQETGKGKAA